MFIVRYLSVARIPSKVIQKSISYVRVTANTFGCGEFFYFSFRFSLLHWVFALSACEVCVFVLRMKQLEGKKH